MAYVNYSPDPNDPNSPQQLVGPNGLPQTSSGVGDNSVNGSPQGAASVTASSKTPPVQDLKAYLTANAPQAVRQGQKIGQNLSDTANQVSGDINTAQQAVDQQVQSQNVNPNSQLVSRAAQNPYEFTKNQDDVAAFKAQRDANYSGPTSFESTDAFKGLNSKVSNAVQKAPDITQPEGLAQLSRAQAKNPTTGQSNLDALLLQESPDAINALRPGLKSLQGLPDYLASVGSDQNNRIKGVMDNTRAAREGVSNTFVTGENAVVPSFQNDLRSRLESARTGAGSAADKLIQDFLNGGSATPNPTLTADQYKALGYSPVELQSIFDSQKNLASDYKLPVDLGNTLTRQNPNNVFSDVNSIATNEDYLKDQAISELLGNNLYGNPALDQSRAGNAGKTDANLVDFDIDTARSLTTEAIRNKDFNFLNSLENNTGRDIVSVFQQATPQQLSSYRASLPADQQILLDKVLARLGIIRGEVVQPPIDNNPNGAIGFGRGNTYIDPRTGERKVAY